MSVLLPRDVEAECGVWRTDDISGGQVLVVETGILAEFVASRFAAGETMADLAADYQIPVVNIERAIRAVVGAAFTRYRGLKAGVQRDMEASVPLLIGKEWRGRE